MRLVDLAGYDPVLVARLEPRDRRFFVVSTVLALLAAAGGGVGAAYGAHFPFGVFGVVVGLVFGAFMVNLVRLLHAGSGYPVHLAIDDIDTWHPSGTAGAVLLLLGLLLSQPLVMLLLTLVHGGHGGLVAQERAAWAHPAEAGALTAGLALLIAAPGWLRIAGEGSVRAYERERWIDHRIFVDDAYAEAQDAITALLADVPGFSGTLSVHYADPPYDTQPLLYGLDPALVVADQLQFVRAKDAPAPTPPAARPPPPAPAPAPAPKSAPKSAGPDEDVAAPAWDDASHDAETGPPAPAYLDVGRLQAKRARQHLELVVPFVVRLTGRTDDEVRGLLRAAPDDMRLHQLFSDWKKLRVILLKDASFALDAGLAPILALVVQRPVADVERRLRAAPPDKRLTGVFAPELARRLLKNKKPPQPR